MARQNIWHAIAALSGAAAVSLGAYGAHAFKPKDPYFIDVRHFSSLNFAQCELMNRM